MSSVPLAACLRPCLVEIPWISPGLRPPRRASAGAVGTVGGMSPTLPGRTIFEISRPPNTSQTSIHTVGTVSGMYPTLPGSKNRGNFLAAVRIADLEGYTVGESSHARQRCAADSKKLSRAPISSTRSSIYIYIYLARSMTSKRYFRSRNPTNTATYSQTYHSSR